MTTPEWLKVRDGELRRGLNDDTWLVCLNGHPQYRLFVTTAQGKLACDVTQTVNGKLLDASENYLTRDESLAGGLEQLRKKLGW